MKTLREIKQEYKEFIENIPNYISKLKKELEKQKFFYSFDEIEEIEKFYEKSIRKKKGNTIMNKEFENMIATYFGVAFRWYLGGKWRLDTGKTSTTYGEPFLDYYDYEFESGYYFFPFTWTLFIATGQKDAGSFSQYVKRILDWELKKQEEIKGYKIKPIRNIQ